jgi:two-component system, OmpR family, KDP operon response regulator KdpE
VASPKLLIMDDELRTRKQLRISISDHGYRVVEADSGEEGLRKLNSEECDFVLMDTNLPDVDGLEVCRKIRADSDVPIVVLSPRQSERDKVEAFAAGVDDYVTKPFGIRELLARIDAINRRRLPRVQAPQMLALDHGVVNFATHRVSTRDREFHLTPKECELLRYMASHCGQILPHRRLLQALWGADHGDEVQYLRVFVNQLRKKIELDPRHPKHLVTEPWVGYRFIGHKQNSGMA